MSGIGWTSTEDDALRALIEGGFSGSQAATALNARFGTERSRNAVIGRANRLGIKAVRTPRDNRAGERSYTPRRPPRPRPVAAPAPRIAAVTCEAVPQGVSILEVKGCRWPIWGERADTLFCNQPQLFGLLDRYGNACASSYCECHYFMSIGPGTPSERSAHHVGSAA